MGKEEDGEVVLKKVTDVYMITKTIGANLPNKVLSYQLTLYTKMKQRKLLELYY